MTENESFFPQKRGYHFCQKNIAHVVLNKVATNIIRRKGISKWKKVQFLARFHILLRLYIWRLKI